MSHNQEITKPAIILVRPTLAENIGIAARASLAMGFEDFRLVAPKNGWVQEKAIRAAAWAGDFLARAQCFSTLSEAVADLKNIIATSARSRAFNLPHLNVSDTTKEPIGGILFGNEKHGLSNEEISLCKAVTTIATSEGKSLNMAQAVLLYGYVLQGQNLPIVKRELTAEPPALRAIFARSNLAENEVRMLRGVISALSKDNCSK